MTLVDGTLEDFARDFEIALAQRQVIAAYQPQIDVADGSMVGVEALARWTHPEHGPVAPDVFVDVAQKTGLLPLLTARIISDVTAEYIPGCTIEVAVNVSATQLEDPSLYDMFEGAFATGRCNPTTLTVEVTESHSIAHPERVAAPLEALAAAGVTISVDDFGTGHSSFARVESLHARELKLDKSLVQSEERVHEVAQIITEAHRRGIRVVGEGVETQLQLDRLAAAGCDRAQGYLISKPQPADVLVDWYRNRFAR
ncbi:EAL domain-containing protein [Leifsonia shinshuensis]|uniref:EAL domain-containing protein n=1 Tax=Leifsonia shinshuensis TaxID=150026 RepID=UPI002863E0D0|nr:EAL domain-containing protein [Leifsonia shinshuensis]MDR6969819.1 EAL domain-containing protein (putative c-di-GMP-specific phosphodiesterase class I) [Leifsonia shinshuensis]